MSNPSQTTRRIVTTSAAGPVGGPYSQGVVIGQMLYLSGSIGLDPATGKFAGETIQEQARQVNLHTYINVCVMNNVFSVDIEKSWRSS